MSEDIKGLIEKIQQEGIKAAEEKARDIETAAKRRAEEIIANAEKEAEKLTAEARRRVAKMEASGEDSLKQAARDTLLALRKEINAMLEKLIVSGVGAALKPDELTKIITALIKGASGKDKGEIIISLGEADRKKIKSLFLSKLKDEVKKGITLRPSEDIRGGFTISYDRGRSHYDFTDKGLAEYLSAYLKPKLAALLKQSVPGGKKSQKSD
jgi:V/A-type H+-transporting ATPase subunit E